MEFLDYDTRLGGYAVVIRDGRVLLPLADVPSLRRELLVARFVG
jgi:hypothetical protein